MAGISAAERAARKAAAQMTTTPNPSEGNEVAPRRAGAKVTVACKIGVAWLEMQLQEKRRINENTQTGVKEVDIWVKTGNVIRVRGTAYPRGTPPTGFAPPPEMFLGAALTRNIDKDFWDAWVEQNKRNPIVVNRMIFAYEDIEDVRAMSRETESMLSGLEPLNPVTSQDARIPKPTNKSVSRLEKGER